MCLKNSSEKYTPLTLVTHVYVPNLDEIFEKAEQAACKIIERPKLSDGDPDKRGIFKGFAGNIWSVSTQQ